MLEVEERRLSTSWVSQLVTNTRTFFTKIRSFLSKTSFQEQAEMLLSTRRATSRGLLWAITDQNTSKFTQDLKPISSLMSPGKCSSLLHRCWQLPCPTKKTQSAFPETFRSRFRKLGEKRWCLSNLISTTQKNTIIAVFRMMGKMSLKGVLLGMLLRLTRGGTPPSQVLARKTWA